MINYSDHVAGLNSLYEIDAPFILYIYIYIYIERERERERDTYTVNDVKVNDLDNFMEYAAFS